MAMLRGGWSDFQDRADEPAAGDYCQGCFGYGEVDEFGLCRRCYQAGVVHARERMEDPPDG